MLTGSVNLDIRRRFGVLLTVAALAVGAAAVQAAPAKKRFQKSAVIGRPGFADDVATEPRGVRVADSLHVDDGLWAVLEPLLPQRLHQRIGRPRVDDRIAFTAILFVLVTGVPWRVLPREFGCPGVTAWRRLRDWQAPACGIGCIASCSGGSTPSGSSTGRPESQTPATSAVFAVVH